MIRLKEDTYQTLWNVKVGEFVTFPYYDHNMLFIVCETSNRTRRLCVDVTSGQFHYLNPDMLCVIRNIDIVEKGLNI